MSIDPKARYSETHEWVRQEGDRYVYGITDHAQAELSDVVYVELPEVGAVFSAGDTIGVIESVKAASDLILPVGGTVVEINTTLNDSPDVVNSDPYNAGWIIKIKLANPAEWEGLLLPDAYAALIAE